MRKLFIVLAVSLIAVSCKKDDGGNNNCALPGVINLDLIGSNSVVISWDPNGETAFELEYGPIGFSIGTGTVIQTSQTNLLIDGLLPSTNYEIYIRSNCGSDGFSGYISTDFVTDDATVACNTPTDLQLISVSDTTITIGWSENNETAWEIEYGPSGFVIGTGTVVQTSQSSYQITGLQPSTTYEIYVRANCGSDGFSEYTDALVVTTDP